MDSERFNKVVEEQLERSTTVLFLKNAGYNPSDDKLRGFKNSAAMRSRSVKDTLAGMMLKHTQSIYDMCDSDETFSEAVWNEKITDHINYLLLLRAVVQETEIDMQSKGAPEKSVQTSSGPVMEIVVQYQHEAEALLNLLKVLIRDYGEATVSDLYRATGIAETFNDTKRGWRNLEFAGIAEVANGYRLELPSTEDFDEPVPGRTSLVNIIPVNN